MFALIKAYPNTLNLLIMFYIFFLFTIIIAVLPKDNEMVIIHSVS